MLRFIIAGKPGDDYIIIKLIIVIKVLLKIIMALLKTIIKVIINGINIIVVIFTEKWNCQSKIEVKFNMDTVFNIQMGGKCIEYY